MKKKRRAFEKNLASVSVADSRVVEERLHKLTGFCHCDCCNTRRLNQQELFKVAMQKFEQKVALISRSSSSLCPCKFCRVQISSKPYLVEERLVIGELEEAS